MVRRISEQKLKKALGWLVNKAKQALSVKKKDERPTDIKDIGDFKKLKMHWLMFMIYDSPKHKKTLKYYDALPLFFPLKFTVGPDGVLLHGLNIHFLRPDDRSAFMNEIVKLMKKTAEKQGYDPNNLNEVPDGNISKVVGKYLNAVYQGMSSSGSRIKVAYRTYYVSRIKGKIIRILPDEWENAINLILPRFQKMGPGSVYKDIEELYKKYKGSSWKDIY